MDNIDTIVQAYKEKLFEYEQFLASIRVFFEKHPSLNRGNLSIIHSLKYRTKDPEHLKEKLLRKIAQGREINAENVFEQITDLAGIRVLHLYQDQFIKIHEAIKQKIDAGDWILKETPKAYTWDPESQSFYKNLKLTTELRDTYYTSIHYIVKPNEKNIVCCEIQVRTLFEEIWGEIDHTLNYPHPTESIPCKEQLRVLSKLVSTGTRLADSIFRSHEDYKSQNNENNNL
ncbi:MAG: (p)ppGpp synthetase [Odoribacter splanchnicus]|nr:(p)ppGpp synthetase [Odoribacter splanchnicus]